MNGALDGVSTQENLGVGHAVLAKIVRSAVGGDVEPLLEYSCQGWFEG